MTMIYGLTLSLFFLSQSESTCQNLNIQNCAIKTFTFGEFSITLEWSFIMLFHECSILTFFFPKFSFDPSKNTNIGFLMFSGRSNGNIGKKRIKTGFTRGFTPCNPLIHKKLLRNSIFYVKTVSRIILELVRLMEKEIIKNKRNHS